jgi:hypothetical protein
VGGNYVGNPATNAINPSMPGELIVDYMRVYDYVASTNPPAVPTGLIATPGGSQVSLSWNVSSNATSYNVKRATASGGPYTRIAIPSSPSYTDTGVVNCTTYYYVVSATNSVAESANSSEASATLGSYSIAVNSGGSAASPFATSAQVTGKVYAPGYALPTPANLTTAIGDMETAYTDAAGRAQVLDLSSRIAPFSQPIDSDFIGSIAIVAIWTSHLPHSNS